jgi:hypothetical protein
MMLAILILVVSYYWSVEASGRWLFLLGVVPPVGLICSGNFSVWTRNVNATFLLKNVFVTPDKEMESQLRGVSSGQPQLFAEIVRSHDLHALPEQPVRFFYVRRVSRFYLT